MTILWRYPLLLTLAPIPLLALAAGWWRAGGHCRRWKTACLFLPLAAALAAIVAAAGPVWRANSPARSIVVLLDLSPAADLAPWRNPSWLRHTLRQHLSKGMRVTLVGMCRHVHCLAANLSLRSRQGWPRRWPVLTGSCSSLRRALAWNAADCTGAPRWLFTAGLIRWRSVNPAVLPFAMAVSVATPTLPDAGITSLRVQPLLRRVSSDRRIGHEAQRLLRVGVAVTGAMRVLIQVRRNGRLITSLPLQFHQAGGRVVEVRDTVQPASPDAAGIRPGASSGAPVRYTVRLRSGDPWPEDNRASIFVYTRGTPRILLVRRGGPTKTLDRKLKIYPRVIPPSQLPVNPAGLAGYQEIILDNVPRTDFPPGAGQLIARWVRATGGGLLIRGTDYAFGPGGYAWPAAGKPWALDWISPLSSLPPRRPPGQFVFLIDASGSMGRRVPGSSSSTRFTQAAQAVAQAASLLPKRDRLAVLAFSGCTVPLLSGTVGLYRGRITTLLSRVEPTGPTHPDSALPWLQHRLNRGAMLMLLTDGRIPRLKVQRWVQLLRRRSVHLAIIAPPGASAALRSLAQQVRAPWLHTTNPRHWCGALRGWIYRRLVGRAEHHRAIWSSVPAGFRGTTRHWDRVWLKKHATVLAAASQPAAPLAARWRRGLGQVAAVAFSSGGRAYPGFLHQVLRHLLPPPGDRRFQVRARRRGGRWLLRVDARDPLGFINAARLRFTFWTGSAARLRSLAFTPTAPGRYRLALPRDIRVFSGVLTRQIHGHWIGLTRVAPPDLPPRCFPATANAEPCPWRTVLPIPVLAKAAEAIGPIVSHGRLGAAPPAAALWRPMILGSPQPLAALFWMASVILALAALWLRE